MITVNNYRDIALQDTPIIDVRAPLEYVKGTILGAINQPLMDDEQRHLVGICYKNQGQQQAISLGHQLVSGPTKQQRVDAWCQYFDSHPNTHILCFRGGLRSRISQQWMVEAGRDIPLIKGGYKAFRRYLIDVSNDIITRTPVLLVSGKTGCGKTQLLDAMTNIVDLEGLANHRGSAFGKNISEQPSQIDFENQLAKRLLQLQHHHINQLILEDESRMIGRCALPQLLRDKMQQSPVYLLEDDFDSRVARILQDYVVNMAFQFQQQLGQEQGFLQFNHYLTNALNGIKRRLGALRHQQLSDILQQSLQQQLSQNDINGHRVWISALLQEYYDPLYQYQLDKKQARIVYRGDKNQLLDILRQQQATTGET